MTTKLGLPKFVLVGNSMGGGVAWNYALKHPDRLQGLVLVDAAGWPQQRADGRDGPFIFKVLRNPVGRFLIGDLDTTAMTRAGLKDAFAPTPEMVDEAMVARYVEMSRARWQQLRETLQLQTGSRAFLKPRRVTRFMAGSGTQVMDDPAAMI